MASFDVAWDEAGAVLITRLRSPMAATDVTEYRVALDRALALIPSSSTFLWLSTALGYDALGDRAAHQELRAILPLTLAAYGFRTSMLDLYEGANVPITRTRDVACRAIAHVHHDAGKMSAFDEQLGRPNERYFADEGSALSWLAQR